MKEPAQIRAGLHAFWDILKRNKHLIHIDVLKKLDGTPFGEMIRLIASNTITTDEIYNTPKEMHRIVKLWSKEHNAFRVGDDFFYITPEDVNHIFGFACKGLPLDFNAKGRRSENAEFYDKYFPREIQNLTKKQLEIALDSALVTQSKRDIVILLVQLLFCTFLFANTSSTISWALANVCVDIDGLKTIAWSHGVLDFLKKGLNTDSAGVSGCVPLVMYWLADKTKICEKVDHRASLSFSFCRWKMSDLAKKISVMSDQELAAVLKESVKEEVMMEAFNESLRDNLCYLDPPNDADAPSFDIWRPYIKEELKRKEEEAKKNLIEIIGTLEEKTSQPSSSQSIGADQEILKRLYAEKEKFLEQSHAWWHITEQAQQERAESDRKMKIMKSKLDEKWKKSDELEREVQKYQVLLARQMSTTSALEKENAALQNALDSKNAELQNLLASTRGEYKNTQVDESMETTNDVDVDNSPSEHEDTINLGESLEDNEDENRKTSIHYDHADQCNNDTNLEDEITLAEMSSVIKKRKLSQEVGEELTLADIVDHQQVMPKRPTDMTTDEIAAQLRQKNPVTYEAMSPAIAMLKLLENLTGFSKVSTTTTEGHGPKKDTMNRSDALKIKSPSSLVKKVKARDGRKETKDKKTYFYPEKQKGGEKK